MFRLFILYVLLSILVGCMAFILFPHAKYNEFIYSQGVSIPSAGADFESRHRDNLTALDIKSFSVSRHYTCIHHSDGKEHCNRLNESVPVLHKTLVVKEEGEWIVYVRSHPYRKDWAHLEPNFDRLFRDAVISMKSNTRSSTAFALIELVNI